MPEFILIFPNQLFENVPSEWKNKHIFLLEEPVYFGHRNIHMNFNKLKLLLHRASMKYYFDYLKSKLKSATITYVEFSDLIQSKYPKDDAYTTYDVVDHFLRDKLKKIYSDKIKYLKNPNFILETEILKEYHENNKHKKTLSHKHFFDNAKKYLGVLVGINSMDTENRNKLPDRVLNSLLKNLPKVSVKTSLDKKYIEEAKKYIQQNFPTNYGDISDDENIIFPVTHRSAKRLLDNFIVHKLHYFGTYQDSIVSADTKDASIHAKRNTLFHSLLSSSMNVGLINPLDIVKKIMALDHKKIGMNNIEGFIRQIIGWREYQRYCYEFYYKNMTEANIFNNTNKISKKWYDGTTGILPVDEAIKNAFKYGYLHHISRLMIMCNIFNLCNINPHDVYKWFMEFSIDSYDWVMVQNVYSMGMWADGGLSMRKPYISSSSYILKMSNYSKKSIDNSWIDIWKALFYKKIVSNTHIFSKTPLVIYVNTWKKMSLKEKKKIEQLVKPYLE